ncbi:ferrochelatase [Pontibacillus halophilus JSM 076056 = DSM 19796]|uniref:Coproporphyrin III ferrochelatase n=1 Tax=Pontibacillus halophilus JSM 076056 = DSM 19796 TaxID=1385510 RepID=A0A0A5GPT7_9BACI|nr:ferrochelatase [Pontibacillus halophilus]KGX93979.1 ferrochelatase [Pontibacillus halophilus JSM 076056 = DSM 19796]
MAKKMKGLLVMAYGTPYHEDDLIPYYTHIRKGRVPTDEMIEDLRSRYEAIGGISPLARITNEQAEALLNKLNETEDDYEYKLYLGLKHIAPFVEDAVAQMKEDGIEEAVSIVLAPHYSTFSIKSYNGRAQAETTRINGPRITSVESWYDAPLFIQYWSQHLEHAYKRKTEREQQQTIVIFSAHSLPEKILKHGDPYQEQLETTARLMAEAASIPNYTIGWQSEGNTGEPWLGPDVQDLTEDLYEQGYRHFIYAPVGFVSDHLEVLYDNDYECKVVTDRLGATYERPPMPNTDPLFIAMLSDVVLQTQARGNDS